MKEQLKTIVDSFANKYLYTKNAALYIKLQDGTVLEKEKNGLQASDIILVIIALIAELDKKAPCIENQHTINHLNEAFNWQLRRTFDRQNRNVEGTEKP